MAKIKLDFSDFWGGFEKANNYFYNLLKDDFDIEISSNPDFLFYSVFGNNHLRYKCKKIFYTGENVPCDLNYCDYAFTFDYLDDDRHHRLPHYLLYDGYYELMDRKIDDDSLFNRKFCSFLVSNGNCQMRNRMFLKLSKYKKVDSGGRAFNNIGHLIGDKNKWLSEYKFNICFENDAYRPQYVGYQTEKLPQALQSNTIGIYWGNPRVDLDFNPKSFVNFSDFSSEDDMVDFVIELDKDQDKYMQMLKEHPFPDGKVPDGNRIENIKAFLYKIFDNV